jgi:hypothetical protein
MSRKVSVEVDLVEELAALTLTPAATRVASTTLWVTGAWLLSWPYRAVGRSATGAPWPRPAESWQEPSSEARG